MAVSYNPRIVTDGLLLCLDFGNTKCYTTSAATTVNNLGTVSTTQTMSSMGSANYSSNNGGYLNFDGSNDYIEVNNDLIGTGLVAAGDNGSYTLEVWVRVETSSGTTTDADHIIGNNSTYGIGFQVGVSGGNPRINYGARGTSNFYSSTFSYNTWTHIVLSKISGTSIRGYLNGEFDTSFSTVTDLGAESSQSYANMKIGKGGGRINGAGFDGDMAKCAVYNIGLTDAQVKQNFDALRGRYGI